MAPKAITFNSGAVLAAALEVVRKDGWDALTARSVAGCLGASVAPVYSAFGSMESLLRETLVRIRALLQDYTSRSYTELPFLNIGAGIVSFARDEPYFFQALFQKRHGSQDIVEDVNTAILSWMTRRASDSMTASVFLPWALRRPWPPGGCPMFRRGISSVS
jgi:AcrR family transcriptional regulator